MMLAATGKDLTIDSLYQHPSIKGQTGYISIQSLMTLAGAYGMPVQRGNFSLDSLKQTLDAGRPVLCLVNYRPVVVAGLNGIKTQGYYGHFVVAVGYDDVSFLVHDPYHKGDGGAYKHWPNDVFTKCFRGGYDANSGNTYQGAGIYPTSPIAQPAMPAAPPYPMDEGLSRRIRAKALFEKTPQPVITNEQQYQQAVAWLGGWGQYAEPYYIQPGDTLGKIAARRYGASDFATGIAAYNGIADPNALVVGSKILFPLPPQGTPTTTPPPQDSTTTTPAKPATPAAPATTSTYTNITNQNVINAFYQVYKQRGGDSDDYWQAMVSAGLEQVANFRQQPYRGPRISDLPNVPADIKAAVAAFLKVPA
jgi:hypothetical protein